ncbi:MAG: serine/threonine protein kinase [Deltaproteobacteria bacterium]|nr:serine/threonine protein kinase [Deltaproteobacteria bacterium]
MAERRLEDSIERLSTMVAAATVENRPDSTIEPQRHEDSGGRALEMLGRLAGEVHIARELEMHRTLGEGGMGIVRLATQKSLGRKVAVKTLRDEHKNPAAAVRMLTEAWVTGSLEHPNIVPIYDVALDAAGAPVIVLKRIEGTSWDDLMDDAAEQRRRFRVSDTLEWNLNVLMQVCSAAHFAHSRGIIHRDLKPANVMLGEFGECYVLDWGIAVSLSDDGSGRIPLAKDAGDLAGTPSFLAPEMLDGHGRRLSARTDVYLLGGILYQILTGDPPHQGDTFAELVTSVMTSRPSFPPDTPAELQRICARALDADPDARFETPEQLRLALTGYLSRRGATRLAAEAERRLERLRAELARPDARARRLTLYGLWSECAFGFREALAAWPGGAHDAARAGLARAAEAMVDYELSGNDARAAAALIADIDDVSTEVRARVGNALTAQEAEEARLARLKVEHDPRVGQATRGWLAIGMTLVWTLAPLIVAIRPSGWETHRRMMTVPLGFMVLMVLLSIGTGGAMLRSGFNRSIALSAIMMTVSMLASHGIAYLLGIPAKQTYVLHFFIWSLLGGMLAITLEWRFALPAVGYLIGTFIVAWRLDWVYWTMSATSAVLAGTVMWVWHPSGKKPCGPESPQASNF